MTARRGLTGYHVIEAWRGGSCVWFRTATQRRTVRSAVDHAVADLRADTTFITYIAPDQRTRTAVAQVTSGGIWRWQQDPGDLRSFIEQEA